MIIIIVKKNFCVLNRCSSLLTSVHNCLFLTLALSWPNFSEASFFPVDPWTLLVCTKKILGDTCPSPKYLRASIPTPYQLQLLLEITRPQDNFLWDLTGHFPPPTSAPFAPPLPYKRKIFLFDFEMLPDFWVEHILPVTTVFLLNKAFSYLSSNLGGFFYLVFNILQ